MPFLDEIRKQSRSARELMFGLSVFVSVSLIGVIWFNSIENDLFVLLNPEEVQEQQLFFAREDESIFSTLGNSGKDLIAAFGNIVDLFNSVRKNNGDQGDINSKAYILPLSSDR